MTYSKKNTNSITFLDQNEEGGYEDKLEEYTSEDYYWVTVLDPACINCLDRMWRPSDVDIKYSRPVRSRATR